jgi:N-acetylmuramoyl-L-alanine amidase
MVAMVLFSCLIFPQIGLAASKCKTGECQYYQAEKSYKAFLKDPNAQKRRDKWLAVIEEYKKVADIDPKGSFASVGLYKTGSLYKELYQISKNKHDLENAREHLEKSSSFKKSKARLEAEQALKSLPESDSKRKKAQADDPSDNKNTKNKEKDKDSSKTTKKEEPKKKDNKYDKKMSDSQKADELTEKNTPNKKATTEKEDSKAKDRGKGKGKDDSKIIKKDDSQKEADKKDSTATETKGKKSKTKNDEGISVKIKPDPSFPPEINKTDENKKTIEATGKSIENGSLVKGLRFGSLPTRTRIVIDTDKPVSYKHGLLGKSASDPTVKLLYVDIKKSGLFGSSKSEICIDDERVKFLRASIKDQDTVRILVEIKTFRDYKVFSLRSPSRVVIDVWGHSTSPAHEDEHDQDESDSPNVSTIIEASDLASQFQLGVKRIVIDPGHGGQDVGAPGFEKGIFEKDVVLAIGKKLSEKIQRDLGIEVIMTRSDDTFITLEERTRIANKQKADLFISIHTNATLNKQAYGIETYFLNLARDKDSVAVAARENATSEKNISDLQSILDSLMRNTKITESSKLATYVQDSLVKGMGKSYDHINNKGVKQAPFYVLLGARMPAILIETSFISNERECQRLTDSEYQDKLCDSIVDGIRAYIRKTSPMKDSKKK